MTTTDRIAALRSVHKIDPIEEEHPQFGRIYRCSVCGIRVHWIVKSWRHDRDEMIALFDEQYAHAWRPGREDSETERVARAIERISADFTADLDEDEPYETNPEGDPTLNGAFR